MTMTTSTTTTSTTTADRLAARQFVTDGGLETDLIFHRGLDLPEFAAYPLVTTYAGRDHLCRYYDEYADIALRAGTGLALETPTWRANADWGARLGDGADELYDANRWAVGFLQQLAEGYCAAGVPDVLISGMIGPRGDGYEVTTSMDPDEAADYHRPQLAAFAAAGADLATALTLGYVDEARGVVRAARSVGIPIAVSFTVETDGRLPDGTGLADAIRAVDETDPPEHFGVNCAHPAHVAPALATSGAWRERIGVLRCNASTLSHAELDEAEKLDEGDPTTFAHDHDALDLPAVRIIGGCCGTDARHVAALWSALD